ncbi:MAG: alanine racemase [Candidatus Eremiobacterota bacterium]
MNNIFDTSGNEILIAGYPLSFWTDNYKLPLHISYEPVIRENLKSFKKVFDSYYRKGLVCYAAKACTAGAIFNTVREEGCGADVASYNEAKCALNSGIETEKIVLNGNCKEDFLIEEAIEKNILLVADSIEEFKVISHIAGAMGKKAKTLIRISGYELSDVTAEGVFTAGLWTKFGVPLKEIPGFIKSLDSHPSVEFLGFHTHIGSQITDLEPYGEVLGKMIDMAYILKDTGRTCKIIDIGGGYPVSYVNKEEWEYIADRVRDGYIKSMEGDFSEIFAWNNNPCGFKKNLKEWRGEKFYSYYPKEKMLEAILTGSIHGKHTAEALKSIGEPLLIIEPGRSIADDGGLTLAKVNTVRKIAGNHNLITIEMGVTSHSESLLENILRRWDIITDYHKKDEIPFETFVGGNLCFSGDMIARYKIKLQRKPRRGDILLIHDTGAYCSGFMESNPNSFPRPDRVMVKEDGHIECIRKRDTFEEIFQ